MPNDSQEDSVSKIAKAIEKANIKFAREALAKEELPISKIRDTFLQAQKEADRSSAILQFALAEEIMLACFQNKMNSGAKAAWKQASSANGILSTASNRIALLELLYWIKPQTGADLRIMKSIRNKFAHHANVHTFEDQQIRGWVNSLTKHDELLNNVLEDGESPKFTLRQKFDIRAVSTLCHLAMDLAVGPTAEKQRISPLELLPEGLENQSDNLKEAVACQAECMVAILKASLS